MNDIPLWQGPSIPEDTAMVPALTLDSLGIEKSVLAIFRKELSKNIDTRARVARFAHLHRFFIVFDSDRGRYPTGIVIAAETVAQHWAQMAAQKESYSGTLIVVSPDKGCPLWCQDGLRTAFIGQGCWKEFSFPASFPRTAVREGKLGEEDSNLTQFVANKIFETAYLGGDPKKKDVLKKHTVVVAVLPEDIIDGVLDEFELHRDQVPLPRSEIQDS